MLINGYTKQKLIDVIKARFTGKATNGDECRYLTGDGKRCAVGLFIPDGHEGQKYNGGVNGLLIRHEDLAALMPLDITSLEDMQGVHDGLPEYISAEEQKQRLINWVDQFVKE